MICREEKAFIQYLEVTLLNLSMSFLEFKLNLKYQICVSSRIRERVNSWTSSSMVQWTNFTVLLGKRLLHHSTSCHFNSFFVLHSSHESHCTVVYLFRLKDLVQSTLRYSVLVQNHIYIKAT